MPHYHHLPCCWWCQEVDFSILFLLRLNQSFPSPLQPIATIGASPLLSETVIRVSQNYWVNSLLVGTSYTGLEAFKYVTSAMPEQSCESLGSLSNDIRDDRWIQSWGSEESLPTETSSITFNQTKHHLSAYQRVLIDQLLTLPLLSEGAAPLRMAVYTAVPHNPMSPTVPSKGTSHHSSHLNQASGISALGPKVYSV